MNLQARINQEKGNAESVAPLEWRKPPGHPVGGCRPRRQSRRPSTFFRDTWSDTPLTIVIFLKQDEHGDYQVLAKIQGVGSDIEFISYPDLGGARDGDILVSWQVNAATHTLAAYTITGDQPAEIFKANSGRCLSRRSGRGRPGGDHPGPRPPPERPPCAWTTMTIKTAAWSWSPPPPCLRVPSRSTPGPPASSPTAPRACSSRRFTKKTSSLQMSSASARATTLKNVALDAGDPPEQRRLPLRRRV